MIIMVVVMFASRFVAIAAVAANFAKAKPFVQALWDTKVLSGQRQLVGRVR
jgi:hypothetical protein